MIELENLTKQFGSFTAVDRLTCQIRSGTVCGFLGSNGAGKSTTMNMITGYLAPSDGTVRICGVDVLKQPEEAKRRIGYLPEIPALYPEMTVEEYLRFTAELKRIPRAQRSEAVETAILRASLSQMKGRLISTLSKGYRQRVGIANAILGEPEVILLDEPTAGLDPHQNLEIRELIRSLRGKHTVLLSSHILAEVSEVCDHIVILHHGRLAAAGTPRELEAAMGRGRSFLLSVAGEAEAALAAVRAVEGVGEAEVTAAARGTTLRVRQRGEADIRIPLFRALAQADLPILSLQEQTMSLEDIFLRLTEEQEEP